MIFPLFLTIPAGTVDSVGFCSAAAVAPGVDDPPGVLVAAASWEGETAVDAVGLFCVGTAHAVSNIVRTIAKAIETFFDIIFLTNQYLPFFYRTIQTLWLLCLVQII
jgi:hypothetical protein